MNPIEKYRPTMSNEVLHSWAADAQVELDALRARVKDLEGIDQLITKATDDTKYFEAKCRRYEDAMVEVRDEIGSCMKRDAEAFMRMTLEQVGAWDIARHNQTHGYVLDRIRDVLGV